MSGSPDDVQPAELTSLHLRRACDGERESLAWVVARFTPFLRLQAGYRLQGGMRRLFEPEDLVDEVWMVVLPKLSDLHARDGHRTPVLLKFLATTLLHRVNNHITRFLRTEAQRASLPRESWGSNQGGPPAPATGVVERAVRNEAIGRLEEALQTLEPDDRELLVLRGIEQHPNQEVARRLGVDPSTATRRYQRLLERLQPLVAGAQLDGLPG